MKQDVTGMTAGQNMIDQRYELISRLKSEDGVVTCLVSERGSREKLLLKRAETQEGEEQLRNEYRMLQQIHAHDGKTEIARLFPALRESGEEGGFWFTREWIEGHTVEALTEAGHGAPGMGRTAALDCLIHVTEQLRFLHGLKPPLIHRDIKPQNIVVDAYGRARLIDLGIARSFRPEQDEDTLVSGTRATAPPEQFGYRQTDERSDLYSCGVLLRYALSGEYREQADAGLDEDLRRIVVKATRFDPAQRYQRADMLLKDLLAARYGSWACETKRPRLRVGAIVCILLAVLAVAAVPVIRRYGSSWRTKAHPDQTYTFREPLIGQAVREMLQKPEGEITLAELEQVTALRIYGRQVFQYEEQFWLRGNHDYCYIDSFRESGLYLENGGISSLEDIRYMPNLTELSLYNQSISDIGALHGTRIARLGLAHNPITSLGPLRGNMNIISLNISSLPLDSLGDVATLGSLRELNISSLHVNSVELLTALPLRRLQMYEVSLRNVWELQRLTELETLETQNLDLEGVSALSSLTRLTSLTVTHPMGLPLKALEPLNMLEHLYFYGEETSVPESDPVRLPRLQYLEINNGSFPHFRWLSGMPELRQLLILNARCDALDGLDSLRMLTDVTCGEPLAAELRAAYPDAAWTAH